jgi:5-methylcytosine-specific restriction endonuclease McrA
MSAIPRIPYIFFSLFLAVVIICVSTPETFARGGGGGGSHGGGGGHSSGGYSSGHHSSSGYSSSRSSYSGAHSSSRSTSSGGHSSRSYSSGHSGRSSTTSVSRHSSTSRTHSPAGTYKSGYAKVERSETAKHQFLAQRGLPRIPAGSNIDHIVPLSKGGADSPSNMQLLSVEAHHQKTAAERRQY